ncbi:MAG: radical SAM protein [Deltaproteobacteria bacterium]
MGRAPEGRAAMIPVAAVRGVRLDVPALGARHAVARAALRECRLCPRRCGADRLSGETGFCGAGADARVAAVSIHHGEEPPVSGTRGSGTVFFSHCNLACLFCQNYPISRMGVGRRMATDELGDRLLWIERKGAHNVNFVTPTPHVPQMIGALLAARERGFSLPVVYNTNGYETPETVALLDGVVDIYLPDVKYRSEALAAEASGAPDYPAHNGIAVVEMLRQAGPLAAGADGIAVRGVLIRHLVLPGKVDESVAVLAFIRDRFGPDIPLSLMGQYFPAHRAHATPGYERKLSIEEYERAVDAASGLGLTNVFIQEIGCPGEPT